jgi:ribose transport system substrate-binding protein
VCEPEATGLVVAAVLNRSTQRWMAKTIAEPDESLFQSVKAHAAAKVLNVKMLYYVPTKPDSISEQMSEIEGVVMEKSPSLYFEASRFSSDAASCNLLAS